MARFVQPTYNLAVKIWRAIAPPPAPATVVTVGNLTVGDLVNHGLVAAAGGVGQVGGMWLRLPAKTDVRDASSGASADIVEVPAGSGRFYTSTWVDDIGAGFPNEHRFAVLVKSPPWPVPFPGGGGGGGGGPSPAFVSPTQGSSGLAPVQMFSLLASPTLALGDCAFCAYLILNYGLAVPTFKHNGSSVGPVSGPSLTPQSGVSGQVGILAAAPGVSLHTWTVDFGLGNSGYIALFGVNCKSLPGILHAIGANIGVGTPPVNVPLVAPFVGANPAVAMAATAEINGPGIGPMFVAPFADFAGVLPLPVGLVNVNLNFGGYVNPPPGGLTATRASGATGDSWGAAMAEYE